MTKIKQIKVIVHKIMPAVWLDLMDITLKNCFFLKVAAEEVGERREQKPLISLINSIRKIILKTSKHTHTHTHTHTQTL
jgi:hypothetical protein